MRNFEGFVREEVIRSGSSKIPGDAVLDEPWPCEDCPCSKVCATGLSCQAFTTYAQPNRSKSSQWVEKTRIPTRAEFIGVLTPQ